MMAPDPFVDDTMRARIGGELDRIEREQEVRILLAVESGSRAWRFASPDPNFFHRVPKSFPATDGERVYFGSDSGVFWCLDARDGSIVWRSYMVDPPVKTGVSKIGMLKRTTEVVKHREGGDPSSSRKSPAGRCMTG